MFHTEVVAFSHYPASNAQLAAREMIDIRTEARHVAAMFQMELARTPVIIKPVRDIRILLNFADGQARANRMNGTSGNEDYISRTNRPPIE